MQFVYELSADTCTFRAFFDGSVAVYQPFLGSVIALPFDASLIVQWVKEAQLSESDLRDQFSSAYAGEDPSVFGGRFEELCYLLTKEYGLLRRRPI